MQMLEMNKHFIVNNIGNSGVTLLCRSLKENNTLTKLDLERDLKQ